MKNVFVKKDYLSRKHERRRQQYQSIGTNYIFLLQNFKQNVECVENSTHLAANTKKKRKTH